jgi:O-antigen ligase
MLASAAMRTARQGAPLVGGAAVVLAFCALFFGGGSTDAPLVWIGGIALVAAALAAAAALLGRLPAPRTTGPAVAFLGCLTGLVVWMGVSIAWSLSPELSWGYTNRMLAYLGFAALGVLAGRLAPRAVAAALAALLAAVFLWAIATKVFPWLYPDGGRIARLRSPVGYWNELALLADVGVPVALWSAARRRVAGTLLLYLLLLGDLLTYSRFGIALALVAAAAWLVLDDERVVGILALALAGVAGLGVFLVALALHGVSDDHQGHAARVRDGWRFGLVVLAAALAVTLLARALARVNLDARARRVVVRAAAATAALGLAAAVAVGVARAGSLWHEFTNPPTAQLGQGASRLGSASSGNRWGWWQEAWDAFTAHPLNGTGAQSFQLTNLHRRVSAFDVTTEPHSTPLQFLSELGIVGFLLLVGAAGAVAVGVVRRRDRAATALGIGLAAWLAHMVVDIDWSYVATTGPLLAVAGVLVADGAEARVAARRPLLAVGGVLLALVGAYSIAAPWLATRKYDAANNAHRVATAISDLSDAHSLDPLSTPVLMEWAALEDAVGNQARARSLYLKAVSLEPQNPEPWYELGAFEFLHRNYCAAWFALDRSWAADRHGPAGIPGGYHDRAQKITKGGATCRG